MPEPGNPEIKLNHYTAAILDMDGVITQSAKPHFHAWKQMFDDYLHERAERQNEYFKPFTQDDYYNYVDGKPRYQGAKSFLESRGISLEQGSPDDPPGTETVCGLGNRKNDYFLNYLRENGVKPYESTIDFIKEFKSENKFIAAISSSRNAKAVLKAARVIDFFDEIVDGVDTREQNLRGKPDPDIFIEAAKRLGVKPKNTIIIEDAIAGVQAGRAGKFGLVIGVNRSGQNIDLEKKGADIVVNDLSELRGIDHE